MDKQYKIFNQKIKKKSQLTLAIIAGLLILLTIFAIFYIREYVIIERIASQKVSSIEFKKDVEAIRNYAERCVRDTSYEGLVLLGQQGGHIEVPSIINYNGGSYWYLDQINIQPTLTEIRERLSRYINYKVPECADLDVFRQRAFEILEGDVNSMVEFGTENVFINVTYPITVKKNEFEQKFSDFHETYNIRFRRTYELASQIINRHFKPEFDVYKPLALVDKSDFDVAATNFNENDRTIVFTITDRTRTEKNEYFEFSFASKYELSYLKRTVMLQPNSAYIPTMGEFIIYSPDRLAQLKVGTLFSLSGKSVSNISVQQNDMPNVVLNFPFSDKRKNIPLTNPIYHYEPTGTKFSEPLTYTIYWDEDLIPHNGVVGIIGDEGNGWYAIDSNPDYESNLVWTNAVGFSNYTAVDCGEIPYHKVESKETLKPKWPCFVTMLLEIVSIVLMFIPGVGWIVDAIISAVKLAVQLIFPAYAESAGSILGGAIIIMGLVNVLTDKFYESKKNCVSFTPTCDQYITIEKEEKDGKGKCTLKSGFYEGGHTYTLCAKVKKCDKLKKMVCKKCSVTCTAQLK